MPSARFNRELIRLANAEGLNSTEVSALLEYAAYLLGTTTSARDDLITATAMFDVWLESFDE